MGLTRIEHNPTRRQLLVFKVLWLLFFGGLGWAARARGDSPLTAGVLLAAAVLVPLIGSARPRVMRLVYVGMAYLTFPIGFVLSYVLLAAIFYLVLTPTGLIMRLAGHDPLTRRFDRGLASYWTPRPTETADDQRYFRQF